MVKTESEPISDEEIEEETDIEDARVEKLKTLINDLEKSKRKKIPISPSPENNRQTRINKPIEWKALKEVKRDGTGYGDLSVTNVMPDMVNQDSETYVGAPAENNEEKESDSQPYIQEINRDNRMSSTDLNKLKNTKIGDHINYFDNGVNDNGIIAKMSSSYITIFKEDGTFHDVHINDTFFVADILIDKTWNQMNMEERTQELIKVKALSPRFLTKTWEDLPNELRKVIKSDQEQGSFGNAGGNPNMGVSTNTDVDADDEYEGNSHDDIQVDNQFQHDSTTPETDDDETKKGVPNYNLNTWGIRYANKSEKHIKEEEQE